MRAEANVLHGQWTREFPFPIQILLGDSADEFVLAGITRRAVDLQRFRASERYHEDAQYEEGARRSHDRTLPARKLVAWQRRSQVGRPLRVARTLSGVLAQ